MVKVHNTILNSYMYTCSNICTGVHVCFCIKVTKISDETHVAQLSPLSGEDSNKLSPVTGVDRSRCKRNDMLSVVIARSSLLAFDFLLFFFNFFFLLNFLSPSQTVCICC